MPQILVALVAGVLFGAGLTMSHMVNPAKILNFLDIAGRWDPSLAFVLAGAAGTAALGFRLARRRTAPLFATTFQLPTARDIDRRLVIGAVIFGIGWGLVGLCPGPAIAALALDASSVVLFVMAMLIGMVAFRAQAAWTASRTRSENAGSGRMGT